MIVAAMILGGLALLGRELVRLDTAPIEQADENENESEDLPAQVATAGQVDEPEPDLLDDPINRNIAISTGSLALLSAGTILGGPLVPVGRALVLWTVGGFFREGVEFWQQDRRVGVAVLDAVVLTGALATGLWWVTALMGAMSHGSRKLLQLTEDTSHHDLTAMLDDRPSTVWCMRDDCEVELTLEDVRAGDVSIVEAGMIVPFDGLMLEGRVQVDQRALTGESAPVLKEQGDQVFAMTMIVEGRAHVVADRAGREAVADEIVRLLRETTDYRERVRSRGERVIDRWVLPTMIMGGVTLPLLGPTAALSVLFASFGYTMRYTAPIAVLNFLRLTSNKGILVKDGRALEMLAHVDLVIFDKTGTLTQDRLLVVRVIPLDRFDEDELVALAGTVELRQTHPIARALVAEANARRVVLDEADEIAVEVGFGLTAKVGERRLCLGSDRWMDQNQVLVDVPAPTSTQNTRVFLSVDGTLCGMFELANVLRPEAQSVVDAVRHRGITTMMLSGDREDTAQEVAASLGIQEVFAEVLPDEKAEIVRQYQEAGRLVCFVGDGINDTVALKQADVSISMRGATTIANDVASIVLMDGSLRALPNLFGIASDMNENLNVSHVMSIVPGFVCLGGVYVLGFGVVHAILLYNASLFGGLINAMRPMMGEGDDTPAERAT